MNRRPLKRRAKSSTWRDGESEKSPGKAPIEEEKKADERKEKRRNPKGEREQTPQYLGYERRDGKRT